MRGEPTEASPRCRTAMPPSTLPPTTALLWQVPGRGMGKDSVGSEGGSGRSQLSRLCCYKCCSRERGC